MSIFSRRPRIKFTAQNPLDDGLGDDIAAEQSESDAFSLEDQPGDELSKHWSDIMEDVKKDPKWFSFSKD